jgi:NAD(P)H dehydrogenase (quinone)
MRLIDMRFSALYVIMIVILTCFAADVQAQKTVLVVYHSESGNTERMARAVAEGAGAADGIKVVLLAADQATTDDLVSADAIIVGSPVYNANVTPEISRFIASWPFDGEPLKDKIGAAFVTAGGMSAGEEIVQMNILQSMLIFGMIIVGGPDWTQPFGASAVTGEPPFSVDKPEDIDEHFLEKGRKLGMRVAETAIRLQGRGHE